ncbi:MAG: hypothetical protein QOJ64_3074 [Acidobacteriota bacterium]|nr:hypothetical protein [Acidobacteriota bacterium]
MAARASPSHSALSNPAFSLLLPESFELLGTMLYSRRVSDCGRLSVYTREPDIQDQTTSAEKPDLAVKDINPWMLRAFLP